MIAFAHIPHPAGQELTVLDGVRRVVLALALAFVLAAVTVERQGTRSEPAPVVMTMEYQPPRRLRLRPYRAHHRRPLR